MKDENYFLKTCLLKTALMNGINEKYFGTRATLEGTGKSMLPHKALGATGVRNNGLRKLGRLKRVSFHFIKIPYCSYYGVPL